MKVKINNIKLKVKLCLNPNDIRKGMMGKTFDNNFNGMLFFVGSGEHNFWMKNCIIPLDIIYIQNNTIKKIHHNCEPCLGANCPTFNGSGNIVLEVPGNFCKENGIIEGDNLFFLI